jgi:putative transposase
MKGGYAMKELNFDMENVPERMKHLKRNLKFLGVWQEVEYRVRESVKGTIQIRVNEEFAKGIGRSKYERIEGETEYMCGSYKRSLITNYGKIEIQVPKKPKGKEIKYSVFKPYQRRHEEYDKYVILSIMLGLSGRKQEKFFKAYTGASISASTASNIIKGISKEVIKYQRRELEDKYKYIYIDGVWISVKELNIKKQPLLIAIGVCEDGTKEIIGFKVCRAESSKECEGFVNDLYERGIKGDKLELVIIDGSKALRGAIEYVYPYVDIQTCTVHKLRNILRDIKKKKANRKKLIKEASNIFKSATKQEAIRRYKTCIKNWEKKEPKAIRTLKRDIDDYLVYYQFPRSEHKHLRTTNMIERLNREVRRVTRRIGYFQEKRNAHIYTYLVFKELGMLIKEKDIVSSDMPFNLSSKKEVA